MILEHLYKIFHRFLRYSEHLLALQWTFSVLIKDLDLDLEGLLNQQM